MKLLIKEQLYAIYLQCHNFNRALDLNPIVPCFSFETHKFWFLCVIKTKTVNEAICSAYEKDIRNWSAKN